MNILLLVQLNNQARLNAELRDAELNNLGIKTLRFLAKRKIKIPPLSFSISSNIPKYAGLAGSAIIILNILLLITDFFKLDLDFKTLGQFATLIKYEELNIAAEPQDRFVIIYGGAHYMNFTDSDYQNYEIEAIDMDSLPLGVGIRTKNVSSGDMHRFAFNEYSRSPKLQKIIDRIESISIRGRNAIEDYHLELLGRLLNENQRLTSLYCKYGKFNRKVLLQREIDNEIFELCRQHGTYGVKLAGSSGLVVVLCEEKPDFFLDFKPSKQLSQYLDSDLQGPEISSVIPLKAGKMRFETKMST